MFRRGAPLWIRAGRAALKALGVRLAARPVKLRTRRCRLASRGRNTYRSWGLDRRPMDASPARRRCRPRSSNHWRLVIRAEDQACPGIVPIADVLAGVSPLSWNDVLSIVYSGPLWPLLSPRAGKASNARTRPRETHQAPWRSCTLILAFSKVAGCARPSQLRPSRDG